MAFAPYLLYISKIDFNVIKLSSHNGMPSMRIWNVRESTTNRLIWCDGKWRSCRIHNSQQFIIPLLTAATSHTHRQWIDKSTPSWNAFRLANLRRAVVVTTNWRASHIYAICARQYYLGCHEIRKPSVLQVSIRIDFWQMSHKSDQMPPQRQHLEHPKRWAKRSKSK